MLKYGQKIINPLLKFTTLQKTNYLTLKTEKTMFKVTIYENIEGKETVLKEYQTNVIPILGDIIAGIEFNDYKTKVIVSRQIFPGSQNSIAVNVKNAYE